MTTPEPLPCSFCPDTSMVTTLGWILAAAAVIDPSILAVAGAVCVVCGMALTTVVLPLSLNVATVPAPIAPPTTAAVTAVMKTERERPGRGGSGLGGPWYAGGGEYVQVAPPWGYSLPGKLSVMPSTFRVLSVPYLSLPYARP